ncbi:MAG: right-handed parallel beta-helix repeat-containing protein, partial [Nanoarchaeota archaeon]
KKEKQKKKWNAASETIEASVTDSSGDLKDIGVEIEELREGKFSIKLTPSRSFKAGKYTLKLNLIKDGVTYTQQQDFTWGVLALNLNKSIYLSNDDAFVSIGVLDDAGKIICDAEVTLKIVDPLNYTTTLTTSDGSIKVSPECEFLGVTSLPDYYTDYSVKGIGVYSINLTAITSNGARTVADSFNVTNSVDFDVARDSATRVYPKALYTMDISVIANKNYNGVVNEYVPSSFAVVPQNGMTIATINDTSILSWNVKLKKNDKIKLSYQYDAPDISPEFYVLGPLDIGTFAEARQWQIANDELQAKPSELGGNVQLRAQECKAQIDSGTQFAFNTACNGTYPRACGGAGLDRVSCDDTNYETKGAGRATYGGMNITVYNSSITDCVLIKKVELCHKTWIDSGDAGYTCRYSVDNDGDSSFATASSAACSTSDPTGTTCIDVTSSEDWQCNNFFGSSGSRAQAVAQASDDSGGANSDTYNIDMLFFNVSYMQSSNITMCSSLTSANTVYTLTSNVNSSATCFGVRANNVTIDCHGFTINYSQVSEGYGINNSGFNNSIIRSCNIVQNVTTSGGANDSYGIYIFNNANFNTVYNNSITTNSSRGYGVYLPTNANNNSIRNNIITTSGGSGVGAYLYSSVNNSVYNNTITTSGSSGYGILLWINSNNSVYSNTITTSGSGGLSVYLSGSSDNRVYNNTITTNGSNGVGVRLSSDSNNNSVYSNTITTSGSGGYGVYLTTLSDKNNVYSNTITTSGGNGAGTILSSGSNNRVYSNNITTSGSTGYGVDLSGSSNNSVYNNTITTNGSSGFGVSLLSSSYYHNVYSNTITTSGSSGYGVRLSANTNNNIVYGNTITTSGSFGMGVYLSQNSNNNNVYSNTITTSGSGGVGVDLFFSSNNSVYSNNITTNNVSSSGIYLLNNVFNNTIYDNNITTNNASSSYGVYLKDNSVNNTFYRNRISSLATGILLNGTDTDGNGISRLYGNTFTNDTIVPCSVGCAANYKDIILSNATDIFFLNVSMNKSRIAFVPIETDGTAEKNNITVQWYLTINVTNATNNAAVQNAQISINNSNATNIFEGITDATGGIGTLAVVEYTQNGTINWGMNDSCTLIDGDVVQTDNITCFSPYNISVNITGYNNASRSIEVNRSMFVNMSMEIASAANTAPVIKLNNATFSVDPVSGGDSKILISFNVTDADGVNTINASKTIVNLTLGGRDGQFRFNISDQGNEFGTCNNHTQGNVMIINCTAIMKYYDNASSNWIVNVSVKDIAGNVGINDTITFTYNVLSSINLQNAALNFSSIYLGQQNVLASPHLLMNNTGNDDFGQVNMSAAALTGTTITSESIAVTNFGVNLTNSSSSLRLSFPANGIINLRDTETGKNITFRHGHTGAFAPNADKGNISAFLWVNVPSNGLSTQLYNATWNITAVASP